MWSSFLLSSFALTYCCAAQTNVVYVANDGISDSSCLTGGSSQPCTNLTLVLDYIHNRSSSGVFIKPGQYILSPTNRIVFDEVNDITLARDGTEGGVDISCQETETGLAFKKSHNIVIAGLSFSGCGMEHVSTSLNFDDRKTFLNFFASLYFEGCSNIDLNSISVNESLGIAVQFYYTLQVTISESNFTNNYDQSQMNVSGGVYIEFPYCLPGKLCNETDFPMSDVSNSEYLISGCDFSNNDARNAFNDPNRYILPIEYYHVAFGQGGGLSIFLKGSSSDNIFTIEDCTFTNNTAVYGGGLYVDMQDSSYNNSVIVRGQNVFTENSADLAGGGAYISFAFVRDISEVAACSYSIDGTVFNGNTARHGGGLYYLTTSQLCDNSSSANTLTLSYCNWSNNTAKNGAGLHLFAFQATDKAGIIAAVQVTKSLFSSNSLNYTSNLDQYSKNVLGSGALYTQKVPVDFVESVLFINNVHGTALTAFQTSISFHANISVSFINNTGHNGGAIAFYSSTMMIIYENTSIEFLDNSASNLGGAVYVEDISEKFAPSSCFVQYYNFKIDPRHWMTKFTFRGNKAGGNSNSIYASSIIPCVLGRGFGLYDQSDVKDVFCWNIGTAVWEYDYSTNTNTCTEHIVTGPAELYTENEELYVIPGKRTSMRVIAKDDQGDDVTSNLVLRAISISPEAATVDSDFNYISNNEIVVYQKSLPVKNVTILLDTTGETIHQTRLNVHFQECPPAFHLNSLGKCVCSGDFSRRVTCKDSLFHSSILRGYWIGQYRNTTVVGHCRNCKYSPSNNGSIGQLELGENFTYVNEILCGPQQTGTLCSKCSPGYAPAINSDEFKCALCSDFSVAGIFMFFFLDIVAPYVLLVAVFVSDIPLTSGLLHGPILFGQMITSVISLDGDGVIAFQNIPGINSKAPRVIEKIYVFFYDILNAEFFMTFQNSCLSPNFTYATVIALQYLSAFLPLMFVLFVGVVFYWKERTICRSLPRLRIPCCSFKCPDRFQDIIKSRFKKSPSALATFILLSYTKVAVITGYLLTPANLWSVNDTSSGKSGLVMYLDGTIDYSFSHDYLKYFLSALFIGVPFLVAVPVFLFCFRSNDPHNNGGFFNHLLHQFQQEFRQCSHDFTNERKPNALDDSMKHDHKREHEIWPCCYVKERKKEHIGRCFHIYCTLCTNTEWCSFNHLATKYCKVSCYTKWSLYDFRWLAGGFFILRLLLIMPYMVAWNIIIQYILQFTICIIGGVTIILFRPYKRSNKYVDSNAIEAGSLLLLALLIALSMYQYTYTVSGIPLSTWAYVVQAILVWIPLVWLVIAYTGLIVYRSRTGNRDNSRNLELEEPLIQKK